LPGVKDHQGLLIVGLALLLATAAVAALPEGARRVATAWGGS